MKFGNVNQIDLIVAEFGGSVAAAPLDAQIELFDALIDGSKEAVDGGNLDPKVSFCSMIFSQCTVDQLQVFHRVNGYCKLF